MAKQEREKSVSLFLSRFRSFLQAGATLLTNPHLPNFVKGAIYQGKGKYVCVPGLNCYSCPAAGGACPIGSFQAVAGSSKFRFSYYVAGMLIFLGLLLGRLICGFLCPFGWFQDLINKLPVKKLSTRRLKPLRYLKYAVLVIAVVLLPALLRDSFGVLFYRPFCKWLCPLGAFYSLFNSVSLLDMRVNKDRCISCGKCARVCGMDVDITKTPNHTECIRCGVCIKACPTDAIRYRCGFGAGMNNTKTKEEN